MDSDDQYNQRNPKGKHLKSSRSRQFLSNFCRKSDNASHRTYQPMSSQIVGFQWIYPPANFGASRDSHVASVASKTAVFPRDTVRKRMEVQGQAATAGAFPLHTGGILKTLREVVARDGVRGFYRGLGIGLVKAAPAGALTIWA